jgi:hypothetical protein
MYSTPIHTAAFRSALIPGSPEATATARFVTIPLSPIVEAGQQSLAHGFEILEIRR